MPLKLPPDKLRTALRLQAQCRTQVEIAQELGVSHKTVNRYLSRYNRRVMARLNGTRSFLKARHVLQLEWMASEAARAWERSKDDAETVKTTVEEMKVGDASVQGEATKTETTLKGQSGDVSYLTEARAALAEVRKILGIGADDAITPEDVRKLLDLLAKVAGVEKHPALLSLMDTLTGPSVN